MKINNYFQDKKVTVMGLGLLGRGLGDAKYIAEAGAAEVIVTDLKSVEELKTSLAELAHLANVRFVLGEHRLEDFTGRDLILKAAGVPLDSIYIAAAQSAGVEVAQSAALFAKLSGIPIIGVTGTRGKSTVTQMIYHVLTVLTEGAPVLLGGNVRGVSNLQLLNTVTDDSLAVMELDSWQLQGFGEYAISPQIAVFTSFMPDHMNYYRHDMELYFKDKAQIFLHQEESGVLITTPEVFTWLKKVLPKVTLGQEIVLADSSVIPEDCLLAMPGEHNRLNAALAYEALKAVGLTEEEVFDGLATFPGVPGRLEYLGEKNGVKIYNDNNATTPEATVVGLQAVASPEKRNVVLIMGGDDKQLDISALLAEIPKRCSKVVLFKERGTDLVRDAVLALQNVGVEVSEEEGLEDTVKRALAIASSGEVVLYSPAFSSFGKYFKNEYDRNDQFVSLIQKYLAEVEEVGE